MKAGQRLGDGWIPDRDLTHRDRKLGVRVKARLEARKNLVRKMARTTTGNHTS